MHGSFACLEMLLDFWGAHKKSKQRLDLAHMKAKLLLFSACLLFLSGIIQVSPDCGSDTDRAIRHPNESVWRFHYEKQNSTFGCKCFFIGDDLCQVSRDD